MEDSLPRPGLGTWQNDDPEQCAETVATALDMGYRHLDTAQIYQNESAVGEGIRRSSVPREEVFLATKIHDKYEGPGYEDVRVAAEDCLERLGVTQVDLLYVHRPVGAYDHEETLPAFQAVVKDGLARNLGLSNFTPDYLDQAREVLDVPVFAHQVEMHPLLQQAELVEYARNTGMYLVAFSPLVRGDVASVPEVVEVAEKHGVSPATVSMAWLWTEDHVVPIPKATSESHLRENLEACEFKLDGEDVDKIASIDREQRIDEGPDDIWNR